MANSIRRSDESDDSDLTAVADVLERQDPEKWPESSLTTSSTTSKRSTSYLDGLRGLAALMVYMSHHIPWFYGFDNSETSLERAYGDGAKSVAQLPFIRAFFTGGSAAVAVFFVLSGYVLSIGPLSKLRNTRSTVCYTHLVSASIRRPFRLFLPAAGVSIAFACVMQLPFDLAPHMTWPEPKANLFAQLVNWADEFWRVVDPFRDHGIATRWFPYNPPLWTIAIEFKGSLVVFSAIAAYSQVKHRTQLILFSVTGLIFLAMYEWTMFCFMAGVALAINDQDEVDMKIYRRISQRARTLIQFSMFMIGWWLMCQPAGKREPERAMNATGWYYVTLLTPSNYFNEEYWRFWHAIGAVLLVYGVLKLRTIQNILNTKYIQFLGKVSFALYLVHIPILWTVGDRIYRVFGLARFDFTTAFDNLFRIPDIGPRGFSTRWIASQAIILPLTLILAHFVTCWLDEPSIRVGRWIAEKFVAKKSGHAPSSWTPMALRRYLS